MSENTLQNWNQRFENDESQEDLPRSSAVCWVARWLAEKFELDQQSIFYLSYLGQNRAELLALFYFGDNQDKNWQFLAVFFRF
ncbi:MAG: hypothetical protein WCK35_16470 [Chloroflexota bacterium]